MASVDSPAALKELLEAGFIQQEEHDARLQACLGQAPSSAAEAPASHTPSCGSDSGCGGGGGGSEALAGDRSVPEFKILLVGDGGVGKTAFVKAHQNAAWNESYVPTLGVEVHPLRFHTTVGDIVFKVWDTAGQEKFGGLRDGYYIQGRGAILMFDVTSRMTYKNLTNWHRDVWRVCEDIPMVVVGNKVDCPSQRWIEQWPEVKAQREADKKAGKEVQPDTRYDDHTTCPYKHGRVVLPKHITFHRKKNLGYYDVSAKARYNIERPFAYLARKLTDISDLQIIP